MKWTPALLILFAAHCSAVASTPLNILLLLADDLGYGGNAVPTPRIDALACSGMRFTSYCDASAVCSPSRASLLTGRYPLRFGITRHFSDGPEHLPAGTPTVARLLKTAGYSTMHIGKWHPGGLRPGDVANRAHGPPGPREHGFDHYLAMYKGRKSGSLWSKTDAFTATGRSTCCATISLSICLRNILQTRSLTKPGVPLPPLQEAAP